MPICLSCGCKLNTYNLRCNNPRCSESMPSESKHDAATSGCCGGRCGKTAAQVLADSGVIAIDPTAPKIPVHPAPPKEFAPTTEDALAARAMIERYGMTPAEAAVSVDRQKVYGDPWTNHFGIAQGIAGILQPWAARIARMEPLPPHVVANIFSALKLNRQRMRFHDDNFVDLAVYQRFARAWQREWEEAGEEKPMVIPPKPHPKARLVVRWEMDSDAPTGTANPDTLRRPTTAAAGAEKPFTSHRDETRDACHPAD